MYAIAGAVMLNGACLLMTSTKDTSGIYSMQLMLTWVGGFFIGIDIFARMRKLLDEAKQQSP